MGCTIKINIKGQDLEFTEEQFFKLLLINNWITKDSNVESIKQLISGNDWIKYEKDSESILQQTLKNVVDKLKNSGVPKIKASTKFEEDSISTDSTILTPQQVVHSNQYLYSGKLKILDMNSDSYIKYKTLELLDSFDGDEEKAKNEALKLRESWPVISKDSVAMHILISRLIVKPNLDIDIIKKTINSLINDTSLDEDSKKYIQSLASKLNNNEALYINLLKTINDLNHAININKQDKSNANNSKYLKRNITFDVDIVGMDGKKMRVHLDNIYIDSNGNAYIYNYRISHQKAEDWSSAKGETFKHEMSLIKLALKTTGVISLDKEIFMYYAPVTILYNDDFSLIKSIQLDTTSQGIPKQNNESGNTKFTSSTIVNRNGLLDYNLDNAENPIFKQLATLFIHQELIVPIDKLSSLEQTLLNFTIDLVPTGDLIAKGITVSAQSWIRQSLGKNIVPGENGIGYIVNYDIEGIPDDVITETTHPLRNKELLEKVKKHMDIINSGNPIKINTLIKEIQLNVKNGTNIFSRGSFKNGAEHLSLALSTYLSYDLAYDELDPNKEPKKIYEWKLVNLPDDIVSRCNILLFLNVKTGQIDVIIPSIFLLDNLIEMKFNLHNILGNYLMDLDANINLNGTYGNLELIRGLELINLLIPELNKTKNNYILGNIQVISPSFGGTSIHKSIESLVPHFNTITQYLNTLPERQYKNNFSNVKFVNKIDAIILLRDKYLSHDGYNLANTKILEGNLFVELEKAKNNTARLQALKSIMATLLDILGFGKMSIETIKRLRSTGSTENRILANLWVELAKAINYYSGINEFNVEDKLYKLERNLLPQYANPDSNVRLVSNIYRQALDNTANEFNKLYSPMKKFIKEYYEACGFTTIKSDIVGNAAKLFLPLFRLDLDNNRTMLLKNPYDLNNDLKPYERKFLKQILFEFNRLRVLHTGMRWNYKNYEDPNLKTFIELLGLKYFWVPLKKASKLTQRQSPETRFARIKSDISKLFRDPKIFVEEKMAEERNKGIGQRTSAENKNLDIDMSYTNPYSRYEESNARNTLLTQYGVDYFEYNLEQVLSDYTEKHYLTNELNKALFKCKAILLELHITGEDENSLHYTESIKRIEDFLNVNVFNQTVMDGLLLTASYLLNTPKKIMSRTYIAFNLASMFRDTFEGIWQNYARTLSHFLTDINAASINSSYKHVLSECFKSDRDLSIMSELCLRYRLSNCDSARIAERATTSRGGIFNPEKFMFSTLRGPDFLNRMVLFVARNLLDGVWNAWELNDLDLLVYNWKKDERFKLFALNNTNHPDYNKLKGLYISKVRLYNLEHPEHQISFDPNEEALPDPYSLAEIKLIQQVSDNIYGAYDLSQRAWVENTMLGLTFLTFSTWMNGHLANWFRRPGYYEEYFNILHKQNKITGNFLYVDKDGNIFEEVKDSLGNTKMIDTLNNVEGKSGEYYPLYDKIPIQVQGILYTLSDIWNTFKGTGTEDEWSFSWKRVQEYVLSNEANQENLRKLGWDFGIFMLFALLFKVLLKGLYEDYKANREEETVLRNGVVDLLWRAGSKSYDGFKGLVAMGEYITEDTNPLAINASITVIKDLFDTVTGKRGAMDLLTKDVPVFKPFRLAVKKYYASQDKEF